MTSKTAFENPMTHLSAYTLDPIWKNLVCLAGGAVVDSFRRKDF